MRNGWLAFLWAAALSGQFLPGPQVVTFFSDVDDSDQPYGLYVPANFDSSRKYPLVISLHGAYSNHRLNLRRVFGRGNMPGESDAEASRRFPPLKNADFVVATPYARGTMGYRGIAEKDVYDVLADVKARLPIDEDRVYLTGLSMGGGGALWLGLTRPDVWAAIAAVCPAAPAGTEDFAPNAVNLPVHLFHGALDPLVPVAVSREWQKRLIEQAASVEYKEFPAAKHNSWDAAYKDGAIFDWFAKHRRNRFPERVRFHTSRYRYSSAYWVELTGLDPGEPASIDARFTGKNRLEVHTAGLDGFRFTLAGHPSYTAAQLLSVTIDGKTSRTKVLEFSKTARGWQPGPSTRKDAKRRGQEGPISEVVAARHIYVYGTLDAAPPAEIERRRQQAQAAAEWSTPRARLQLNLRVAADREVSDTDRLTSNLVLFGTKETNALLLQMDSAGALPLQLDPGAADYGLFYVWPLNGRYVAVNSGLPFYAGAEMARRGGLRFLTAPNQLIDSFGDFIFFKGSLENVVTEGNFDRDWKLPAEARSRMAESGVIRMAAK